MKTLVWCCTCVWALSACTKTDSTSQQTLSSSSAAATESSIAAGPGTDKAENAKDKQDSWSLEGEWNVERDGETVFVFKFYGAEASVRYVTKDNQEVVGAISRLASNGFVISPEGGRRHIFRYAIDDNQVFIGRGDSHPIDEPDNFSFSVTTKHQIHFDGKSCALKRAEKHLQTVECSLDRQASPPVFTYDSPIPPMPGPKRPRRMFLVGKTLVSETLYGYRASKVP